MRAFWSGYWIQACLFHFPDIFIVTQYSVLKDMHRLVVLPHKVPKLECILEFKHLFALMGLYCAQNSVY